MKNRYFQIILLSLFIISITPLYSQENIRSEKDLVYTYLGPALGIGFSNVRYEKWESSKWKTISQSGLYLNGGAMLNIHLDPFAADFQINYACDALKNYSIVHMDYTFSGRYLWAIKDNLFILPGLGFYMESAPSNRPFEGAAGLHVPVGVAYDITPKIRIRGDFFFRFGSWGEGSNDRKISTGLTAGVLFRVGRM